MPSEITGESPNLRNRTLVVASECQVTRWRLLWGMDTPSGCSNGTTPHRKLLLVILSKPDCRKMLERCGQMENVEYDFVQR
jgi:hypothetical protein